MKTIDNDIKTGQLKQVYLLYGEEQYLIRQYRDKLKKAMVAEDDTMNFSLLRAMISIRRKLSIWQRHCHFLQTVE